MGYAPNRYKSSPRCRQPPSSKSEVVIRMQALTLSINGKEQC